MEGGRDASDLSANRFCAARASSSSSAFSCATSLSATASMASSLTRTFTGQIEWSPTFGGDARWEYEMQVRARMRTVRRAAAKTPPRGVIRTASTPARRPAARCAVLSRL